MTNANSPRAPFVIQYPAMSPSSDHASFRAPPESLGGFIWQSRRKFVAGLLFAIGRILVISPFPIIFQIIIDRMMPQRNLRGIIWISLGMVVLLVLHQFLSVQGASRLGTAVAHMILHLRARIFEKIQYLSFTYLDRQKTGRLLAKYAFDTQKIDGVTHPILNGFIPDALYSLITLAILVSMNWQLSLVIVLMLPVMGIMRWKYFHRMRKTHRDNRLAQERLTGTAAEFFGALRLVRSFGEEERVQSQLHNSTMEAAQSRIQQINVSSSFGAFSFNSIKFLSLVVVAGGAVLSIYGQVSPGTVLAFVAGLPSLMQPIQMFAHLSDQYFLGREAYGSIKELLNESDVEKWQGTNTVAPIRGRIEFEHLYFKYPEANRDALSDFTLSIPAGQRVALVGPSGAGKSTITNLLLGLYAPQSGRILIDGIPQHDLNVRWFRRSTAIVMQESILLSGTIEDNIRFAREDATDDEVREAASRAQALEFIEKLPEGFKTIVGERGVMLSGGQRQRIAIARALLRDPSILILDEPTSALDYESERLIQIALDDLVKGRTVITIAHRLSTIRDADKVVVLHDGRIVEQGSFPELVELKGHFSRMLAAQELALAGEESDSSDPETLAVNS